MLDSGTGRISGVLTGGFLSGGGDQYLMSHSHTGSGTTQTENANHNHNYTAPTLPVLGNIGAGGTPFVGGTGSTATGIENQTHAHDFTFTTNNAGSGSGQNVPPAILAGITMIRAG
jgi:hypothetical protein